MLDYAEYTIDSDSYQGDGNGYDQLDGDWLIYYKVAKGFTRRVKPEDREDFLHDLILAMARVKAKYELIGKSLTEGGLIRVASYEVSDYWHRYYKINNGLDCKHCSTNQRHKCREEDLYRQCPKAIQLESLDTLVEDGNGDSTPLHELIADDNAIDLVAMVDAKNTLNGYPRKAVQIAYKRYAGYPLDSNEQNYLSRFRKKAQKRLI